VAWVLTAYLLSASVGTAIIGRLGDMYGKEHLLLWTLVVLAGGTLLAGVSSSLALLIVARTIQGAGGGIFPLAFGIIRDEFPRERVAGSIGLMSALLGIGGGVGILAGAAIVEHLSWHWLFWLPLVLIVAAAICTWRFVPESPVRVPGRINWPAAVLGCTRRSWSTRSSRSSRRAPASASAHRSSAPRCTCCRRRSACSSSASQPVPSLHGSAPRPRWSWARSSPPCRSASSPRS